VATYNPRRYDDGVARYSTGGAHANTEEVAMSNADDGAQRAPLPLPTNPEPVTHQPVRPFALLPQDPDAALALAFDPPRWLVEPMIPASGMTVLSAGTGTGKSVLALALAVRTALGFVYAFPDGDSGTCEIADLPGEQEGHNVVYIDGEMDPSLIVQRVVALLRAMEVETGRPWRELWAQLQRHLLILAEPLVRLGVGGGDNALSLGASVRAQIAESTEWNQRGEGVSLVVYDTWSALGSAADRNSEGETQVALDEIKSIAIVLRRDQLTPCASLVLAHPSKSTTAAHRKALRGDNDGQFMSADNMVSGSARVTREGVSSLALDVLADEPNCKTLGVRQEKCRVAQEYSGYIAVDIRGYPVVDERSDTAATLNIPAVHSEARYLTVGEAMDIVSAANPTPAETARNDEASRMLQAIGEAGEAGLTYSALAEQVGLTVDTVKRRYARYRAQFDDADIEEAVFPRTEGRGQAPKGLRTITAAQDTFE